MTTSLTGSKRLVTDTEPSLLRQACSFERTSLSNEPANSPLIGEGQEAHWEVVQRIIFLFYKVNKGSSYVQGMNEIVGPIYFVFANDPNTVEQSESLARLFAN